MYNRKFGLIFAFVFSLFMFAGYKSFAQDDGLTNPCGGTDPDVECPIDSGTVFW